MFYKKIWLFAASIFFIILFFSIEVYNSWIYTSVLSAFGFNEKAYEWDLFSYQVQHMDIEERKAIGWGSTYTFCQDLKADLESKNEKNILVLLPSNEYITAKKVQDISIPEPIVFYLECGLQGAWTTSANVRQCNWAILANDRGQLLQVRINSQEQLNTIIAELNKYKY